ncbi:metal-dependent transcriptional regulator [Candidatus Micrarchaeota archaeon]|nr:metal-dependent transcriptional regulator [Candidatus Micrarchaeota archaeon]
MHQQTLEDYLTAIYRIQQKETLVKSINLAEYLGVRKSSVSEMLRKLKGSNLISHKDYGTLKLTKKGEKLALEVIFKHRVIELFLSKKLGRSKLEVHEEAHKLEHAFSDESINAIYSLLGKPQIGIHGEDIPKLD